MISRRKGRILAFQAVYAWDISGALPLNNLTSPEEEPFPDFSRLLATGTIENIEPIDKMIRKHLENWDFTRVSKVDLAIIRISVYALMFQKDMAPSIVINEAVRISKEFGTDDSYRFVNGVLDAIRKTLNSEPSSQAEPVGE